MFTRPCERQILNVLTRLSSVTFRSTRNHKAIYSLVNFLLEKKNRVNFSLEKNHKAIFDKNAGLYPFKFFKFRPNFQVKKKKNYFLIIASNIIIGFCLIKKASEKPTSS